MESNNKAVIQDLIGQYKGYLLANGLMDELYKWELLKKFRGRPSTEAVDFAKEIGSLSFSNLGYGFAVSALKRIARERPEPTRGCVKYLLDEARNLTERIVSYCSTMGHLFREFEKDSAKSDYQDERMAGLLLAYSNPGRYPIYKANLYEKLCAELQQRPKEPGARYEHYTTLLSEIASDHLIPDLELRELHEKLLPPQLVDADPGMLLTAQNMLYLLFEGSSAVNYWLFQCNPDMYNIVDALNEGVIDEWSVTSYKKDIKAGDKVIIWVTGEDAGCYALAVATTDPSERAPVAEDPKYQLSPDYLSKESVGIEITHNFADNPIQWASLRNVRGFEDLKRGRMGTNFPSSRRMYEYLRSFHSQESIAGRNIWLLSVGKRDARWATFRAQGIAGISFQTGDLRLFEDKEALRAKIRTMSGNDGSRKNDTNACWEFLHTVKIGDIIIPKRGTTEYLGWGIVTSDYKYIADNTDCNHIRSVEWKNVGTWPDKDIVAKTFTEVSKYKDYAIRLIDTLGITFISMNSTAKMGNLNTILYGPPGTGKTYHTISKALEIIGEDTSSLSRKEQKAKFQKLQEAGRIAFVTFHQSMSYEDFVEGIKPVTDQSGSITYEIRPGIFKLQSIEAAFEHIKEAKSKDALQVLDFSNSYEILISRIEEALSQNKTFALSTRSGATIQVVSISERGNLIIKHGTEGTREYIVSRDRLVKLDKAIPDLDKVENVMTAFREAIGGSNDTAFYAVLQEIRKIQKQSAKTDLNRTYSQQEKQEAVRALSVEDYAKGNPLPHLLIIDEINRGNVSQIFGELITLIEEDKRAGNDEALTVTLPYSKETFSVPKNLYIIGTMNTADRSVEALDTALRRRFEFVEMPPRPDKLRENPEDPQSNWLTVNGIILRDMLIKLNTRIEKLLDRDHCIGHAYFIGVKTPEELKGAFQHKIIPLLQEYFYGDYGKIGLVLGNGFVHLANSGKENADELFADFNNHHRHELARREVYHLRDLSKMTEEEFFEALESMKIKSDSAE